MFKKKLLKKIFIPTLFFVAFLFFFSNSLAHQWVAPQKASKIKNPISYSETSVEQGKVIYSKNCMKCHGVNCWRIKP
jgi:mono/diheme cytochrome c family protein